MEGCVGPFQQIPSSVPGGRLIPSSRLSCFANSFFSSGQNQKNANLDCRGTIRNQIDHLLQKYKTLTWSAMSGGIRDEEEEETVRDGQAFAQARQRVGHCRLFFTSGLTHALQKRCSAGQLACRGSTAEAAGHWLGRTGGWAARNTLAVRHLLPAHPSTSDGASSDKKNPLHTAA